MVNKKWRNDFIGLLKKLALGRITSDEFDVAVSDIGAFEQDAALWAIYSTIEDLEFDDGRSLGPAFERGSELRKRLCRWILFLKTDLEYQYPRMVYPGIRDYYTREAFDQLNWLSRFFWGGSKGREKTQRENALLFAAGDFEVWPFLKKADFERAKENGSTGKFVKP